MHSDERMSTTLNCHIAPDNIIGKSEGRSIISSLAEQPTIVAFVDGSNKGTGCGCAWVAYGGSTQIRIGSANLPADWDINSCELIAIVSLLRDLLALPRSPLVVFSDSQFSIGQIRDMKSEGCSSGIWHTFAPLLSNFPDITFWWIPGHVGILGNTITDRLAKRACELVLEPGRITGSNFGFGSYARIPEQRLACWRQWHEHEGHGYYCGSPKDFRHLRTMTRLDFFPLIRIRSGTGMVGHNDCANNENRHHWTLCDRYTALRPHKDSLYDNKRIGDWVAWLRHHDMLGLGIPANLRQYQGVTVTFGNPFDAMACIVRNGQRIIVNIANRFIGVRNVTWFILRLVVHFPRLFSLQHYTS